MFKMAVISDYLRVVHIALCKVLSVTEEVECFSVTMENDDFYCIEKEAGERLIKALHLFWGASL